MPTRSLLLCVALALASQPVSGVEFTPTPEDAAQAANALGLDLYRAQAKATPGGGLLLSPYSISAALAMTYLGADGATAEEMKKVLHYPRDAESTAASFRTLADQLAAMSGNTQREALRAKLVDQTETTPIQLTAANCLFAQQNYRFRLPFLNAVSRQFSAPLVLVDFQRHADDARREINDWVAKATQQRILDLIPAGQPDKDCRLALVNALYLKAAWADKFDEEATKPELFHLNADRTASVPMMHAQRQFGYARRAGYTVVTLPYIGRQLQLVLFIPDAVDGLPGVEAGLTTAGLTECRHLNHETVALTLPKFKLEPATMSLGDALKSLGLHTAFDDPKGSANFDRMAPRTPDEYLRINKVFHKTWLSLDEHGTEATAATTVLMLDTLGVSRHTEPPIEVRVDRPFLFAIQHVESGACLFLGRVTDPR